MKPTAWRQALTHFLAAAAIGLTLTGISALLPNLVARQQSLPPQTAGYALLSLLIGGGMAAFGYVTAHEAQIVDAVSDILDASAADSRDAQS